MTAGATVEPTQWEPAEVRDRSVPVNDAPNLVISRSIPPQADCIESGIVVTPSLSLPQLVTPPNSEQAVVRLKSGFRQVVGAIPSV